LKVTFAAAETEVAAGLAGLEIAVGVAPDLLAAAVGFEDVGETVSPGLLGAQE
jgi:hypothetical protein